MTHLNVSDHSALTASADTDHAGPVLVALKPFEGSDSIITVARWLAARRHADLQAMSVLEMGDVGTTVAGLPPLPEEFYLRERQEVVDDLRARVAGNGLGPLPRAEVLEGPPASTIARVAAERDASTIVIGTGQHGMLGRFLYGERALDVVRSTENPVLVVPPAVEPPFARAMVAVDFSQASVRAATAALGMLDPGAHMTLVHVQSATRRLDDGAHGPPEAVEGRTQALFARFLDALPRADGIAIDFDTVRGDAAGALMRYAEEENVQLIACGRRRHSIVERLLVGSVSTALIRGAPCCVLIAPERPEDDAVDANVIFGEVKSSTDSSEWRALLHAVSERNSGRRAQLSLEADSPAGVESVDRGYLLLAVDYDRRGERADIILGDPHAMGSHLTHRITGIRRIETVSDPEGRDTRVAFDTRSGRCTLDFVGA